MFPYMGGKSKQLWWLDVMFPRYLSTDFDVFVDVFGGAGWVSIGSKCIGGVKSHVYNDFNPYIANIYHCFAFKRNDLVVSMNKYSPSDPTLYKSFQTELFPLATLTLGNTDIAAKYLYLQTQSFVGDPISAKSSPYFYDVTSRDTENPRKSRYLMVRDRLSDTKFVDGLNRITNVENLDCIDVIKKYDSPRTFFYLDPPYYKKEHYYVQDFPMSKHYELSSMLKTISGKFALSYYDFDELKDCYPESTYRWHRQMVKNETSNTSGKPRMSEEILVMNYEENLIQFTPDPTHRRWK